MTELAILWLAILYLDCVVAPLICMMVSRRILSNSAASTDQEVIEQCGK